MDEALILAFVRSAIKSAWSLEVLLLLQRNPQQRWTVQQLVRELRGSEHLVNDSLDSLAAAGIVAVGPHGAQYQPQSAELAGLVTALVDLNSRKPMAVLEVIFTSPSEKIRSFSDAFLFKKK